MLQKIGSTFISRIAIALISLLLVVIAARELGPSGLGTIGLFVLNVTIITLIDGFWAGPALGYFARKIPFGFSMILSLVSAFLGSLLFYTFYVLAPTEWQNGIIDAHFLWLLLFASMLVSLTQSFLSILLGFEKVFAVNLVSVAQFFLLLLLVSLQFFVFKKASIDVYIHAYITSFCFSSLLALAYLIKYRSLFNPKEIRGGGLLRKILTFSFWAQLANLAQTLNYRISFYFLNSFSTRAQLGVFANANQIAEGLWLPAKSIALVQYSKIVNTVDWKDNVKLSIQLLNYSLAVTAFLMFILLLIPPYFYSFLFKHAEFEQISLLLLILAPGILSMVVTMIVAHFFSGVGKPRINFFISLLSLIILILSSFLLVPKFGLKGAAIAATITYLMGACTSLAWFLYLTKISFSDLILKKSDINQHLGQLKAKISRKH